MGGKYTEVEKLMLRQFKKYAQCDSARWHSDWHWLAVANHHSLPTRLLDWTNSPFIALHFATANVDDMDESGAVWMINFEKIKRLMPQNLQDCLDQIGGKVFTVSELEDRRFSLDYLQTLGDFMLLVEPPSIDERIANQYALLSVMSRADADAQTWLECRDLEVGRKIIIPAGLKPEVRERLDMMNMTERVFFPGLDGLSAWLRRYYGPTLRKDASQARVVYRGSHLCFSRTVGGWEYASRSGAAEGVAILGLTTENKIVLVEQTRPPLGKNVIELPAGLVERGDNGTATASRELMEETGYCCTAVRLLYRGTTSPGLSDEINSVYLAAGLTREEPATADFEFPDGSVRHAQTRGNKDEGEHIVVWEVPLVTVSSWLKAREEEGYLVDLKVFGGISFLLGAPARTSPN
jgi:8-oxo-dGTP pyrophosphatase MutT (NUDIX family)